MFALFLVALLALAALAAMGALADSGLRWWSAFGRLRQELTFGVRTAPVPALRPAVRIDCSGFARGGSQSCARRTVSRAA